MKDLVKFIIKNSGILEKNESLFCGANVTQCQAIFEIGRSKNISLDELSQALLLDNSTMKRTIDNLAKSGMVIRSMKLEDRGYVRVVLTKRGEELYKRMERRMENYYNRVITAIPEDKKDQVIDGMDFYVKTLDNNKCC